MQFLRIARRIVIGATLVLCSGCASGLSLFPTGHFLMTRTQELAATAPNVPALHRELNKTVLPEYHVRPGDTVLVESISFDSPIRFPADQIVLADGTIDLGRYGRVVVAGMTVEEVEYLVQSRVEEIEGEVDPVNVRLIDPQGALYYVLGEVNAPGSYPLIGRETVLDAILSAGGLTNRASPCEIILTRPSSPADCRIVLPICYRQITQVGDTTTNYQLMPGDRITVATRGVCEELMFWKARETCEVCECHPECPCPDPSTPHEDRQAIHHLPASPDIVRLPEPISEQQ